MRALSFHDLEEKKGIPCSRQRIDHLIKQNRFPRPFKLGGIPGSANAWDDDEIDQHLEDLKHAAARKPVEPQRCIVRYLLCEASECRAFEDSAQTLRSRRQIVDFLAWMAEYEGCVGAAGCRSGALPDGASRRDRCDGSFRDPHGRRSASLDRRSDEIDEGRPGDMIIVHHKTGALAGKEKRIETTSDRITFGRDPDACDVVFPADETIVARRHFALVRVPSGEWTYDPFGDRYVAVNGAPVDAGAAVHSDDKIELGRPGGPSFELTLEGEGLRGPLPVTETQFKVVGAREAARRAWRTASSAVRFGVAGAVLAIVALGGAAAYYYSSRSDTTRLGQLIEESNRRQSQIAAESISQPVRDKLLQAAYFVVAKDSDGNPLGSASASPIGPNVLATNAHVAAMFEQLKPGQTLFVRSPGASGREYKVIGATVHPGFKAFSKFMSEDPFFAGGRSVADFPVYDVGILRVAEGSNLSPVLEIANRQELEDLKPGFHLAMAGYPTEGVTSAQLLHIAATPTFAAGMVTAMTDMFMLPADGAHGHLVHHNLPAAGGNSGSPMIGPNGKVVAFLNAATMFRVQGVQGRVPSGVLKNYGQRADLLLDLIAGRADAVVEADRAYWQQRTAGFKRGIDVIVPSIVREVTRKLYLAGQLPANMAPILISQDKFRLTDADKSTKKVPEFDKSGAIVNKEVPQRQKRFPVKLAAGKPQLFIAYAEGQRPVQMWLLSGQTQLAADSAENHFIAIVPYRSGNDMGAEVYVTGPDEEVNGTFFVYGWGAPPA